VGEGYELGWSYYYYYYYYYYHHHHYSYEPYPTFA